MQNGDEALPSIILAGQALKSDEHHFGRALLVKMLICILKFLNIALSSGLSSQWYAKRSQGFTEQHFGLIELF